MGLKPTYLAAHGHTVINPALDDDDFAAAVRTAQEAFDLHQPHVWGKMTHQIPNRPTKNCPACNQPFA
jgi:hypothetical protein